MLVEVGPGRIGEVDRCAGSLPEQEVRHAQFAAGAHEDVDRWQLGKVEMLSDRVDGDAVRASAGRLLDRG